MELGISFFKPEYASFLARQHPFLLLGEIICLSITVSVSAFPFLFIASVAVMLMFCLAKTKPFTVIRVLLSFWFLFVFIASAPFLKGQQFAAALDESALLVYRFSHYVMIGMLAAETLAPEKAQYVIYRILRFVPFVDARRTSAIVRIVFALVPQLTGVMQHMNEAGLSRGGGSRHDVLRHTVSRAYSLAAYFLLQATRYAEALESRLYSTETVPQGEYNFDVLSMALFMTCVFVLVFALLVSKGLLL